MLVDSLQKQEAPEERDERGRFLKGVSGNPEGRFKPGLSGNPAGRPPGSRKKATETAELLLEGEAVALTRNAVELAFGGDPIALRLCLDRLIPLRRGRKVQLANVPPVSSVAELGRRWRRSPRRLPRARSHRERRPNWPASSRSMPGRSRSPISTSACGNWKRIRKSSRDLTRCRKISGIAARWSILRRWKAPRRWSAG